MAGTTLRGFWRRLCDTRKIYECASFLSTSIRIGELVGGPFAHIEEAPDLILLDTSILVDFPPVPCQVRFLCDPRYRDMCVRVLAEEVGHGDFSGVIGGDVPFYPDPSQRVLALLFCMKGDALGKAQGICVVRSETFLRLAEEIGEGVVGWDIWGKFAVAPDLDEVPGSNRVYDLSHWSRQYPDTELPDGGARGWVRTSAM